MNNGINNLMEFGKFRLDADKRVLWHEGEPVNLALKEIELLCVLTENGGEVVTKTELLDKIWSDSFVEESNLSRHIYVLRKMFKNLGEREDLIKTVPRRGYRFAGEVHKVPNGELIIEKHSQTRTMIEIREDLSEPPAVADALNSANTKRFLTTSAAAILFVALASGTVFLGYQNLQPKMPASGINSIAVLPFKTIGTGGENTHQGVGLADVLITRLSGVKDLNVRPTSAILSFENQDSAGVGEKLAVDAVLEGTIYREDDKIRVTARLVKTRDNSAVWTGEFEKLRKDEFRLQNEIALQIVDALALNLSGNERRAIARDFTENPDAYQLYTKGRYEWNKRSWAGMIEAQHLFRNAIEKDPNFALAYVGLADTLGTSADSEALVAVEKALELDPNLAEAHATMGFLLMFHKWKWTEAETSFKKAIDLNPGYATAHHWYATLLGIRGRNDEAKAEMRRALDINPHSPNLLADLGQLHYFSLEYDVAKEYCRKALEIYPDFLFAHEYLADVYLQTGEYDKAVEEEIAAIKINESFAIGSAGEKERRESRVDKLRKSYLQGGIRGFQKYKSDQLGTDGSSSYFKAISYSFLGDKKSALDDLEKAVEGRAFLSAFIKADPVFDSLREESRFREILRKMDLVE